MRVLNIVHSLREAGGIETFLLQICEVIHARPGLKIEVCYGGDAPGALAEPAQRLGVAVWGCRASVNPLDYMKRLKAELAARGPYDVLHTHGSNFGGPALRVGRQLGIPVRLAHYHNMTAGHRNDWKRRLYEWWLHRMVLGSATAFLNGTRAGLRYWFPELPEGDPRGVIIRYGIPVGDFQAATGRDEVRRELRIPPDAVVVGHVGRFAWQKNHKTLIAAAARIVPQRNDAWFLLVGDGELRAEAERQVDALGLRPRVVFAGIRRDVPRVLKAMDVFAFPSSIEGLGNSQLEAQAAGLPVVARDIPTAREAVAREFHRFLGPPFDADDFAAKILEMIAWKQTDPRPAQIAGEFGARFTIEMSAQATLAAWGYPGAQAPPDPCT